MNRRAILQERVTRAFADSFGTSPETIVSAPGRVNLIGEHTDYNDGFVLPMAIDYETIVAIGPNGGSDIHAVACDFENAEDEFNPANSFLKQQVEWKNHVRGIAASFIERDLNLRGCNIAITGNVPQGAGLSSSASLGVALGKAFAELNNLDQLSNTDLALIAQHSENDYVGCACGIMDQLASACSTGGAAMLLDCRSLDFKPVTIPEKWAILAVHSGVERGLVDSAYNERREQCERAAAHYGVPALRDLNIVQLEDGRGDLDETSYRRARHVVTENARALSFAAVLGEDDGAQISALMTASHTSMRDDFQITVPLIDDLVKLISGFLGTEGGARMTGGGFGGCVVAMLPKPKLDDLLELLDQEYRTPDGNAPDVFICNPSPGVSVI